MFPNGGHGHSGHQAPGQLPLGQGLGPTVGHHLGHTISPMGPPSSGNQLPGMYILSLFTYFNQSVKSKTLKALSTQNHSRLVFKSFVNSWLV